MEERVNVALSADEMNFIIDAIDSYYYTISRLIDDNSKNIVSGIVNNIYMRFDQAASAQRVMMQSQMDNEEAIIIDVEPEVIPNEE